MTRLPDLPRWALLTLFVLCLGPACANFIIVTATAGQGSPLNWAATLHYTVMQEGLIFGSATLIGPIGLAAALWTLSSPARRLGTMSMAVLWTLTVWAIAYVGFPAQSAAWRAHSSPNPPTATLVRPDGHVGFRAQPAALEGVEGHLARILE